MPLVFLFFIFISFIYTCTIGLGFDSQGSLFLFKNRDKPIECYDSSNEFINTPENRSNSLYFSGDQNYKFYSIATSGTENVYFGTNEHNLAIANAYVSVDDELSRDIENRIHSNASLIKEALITCRSLECFDSILVNLMPLEDDEKISSNFAIFDNSNNGAIYEVYADSSTNGALWEKFVPDFTNKFIFRTNHFHSDSLQSYNPDQSDNSSDSFNRYDSYFSQINDIVHESNFNAIDLISLENFINEDDSTLPFLRTLSKDQIPFSDQLDQYQGYDRPYGYFLNDNAINRARTVSSGLIIKQHALDNVSWINVGNPSTSPYFPIKMSAFIDSNGDVVQNPFPELGNINGTSTLSVKTHVIRENLYNYNSTTCFYNQFIDSYMVKNVLNEIYNIEQHLYDNYNINVSSVVTDAKNSLYQFYDNYDSLKQFICDIGLKKIENGNGKFYFKIIDSSLHSPDSCSWLITDIDSEVLYDADCTDALINPQYDLTISKNLQIEHSISYNGQNFDCNCIITLKGDTNQDASVNIFDVLLLVDIALTANLENDLINYYNIIDLGTGSIDVNIHDIIELVEIILEDETL